MSELVKINNLDIWYEEFGDINQELILLVMGEIGHEIPEQLHSEII